MKAAVIRSFGGPEVLELEELPTPKPQRGQVLIKVLAALVNRLDHYIRLGEINSALAFPHLLGLIAARGSWFFACSTSNRNSCRPNQEKQKVETLCSCMRVVAPLVS